MNLPNTPNLGLHSILGGKVKVEDHDTFSGIGGVMDAGTYLFKVDRATLKKTKDYAKNGGGMFVEVVFKRLDNGGTFWNRYNVVNQKADVETRARSELLTVVGCGGLDEIGDDPAEMVGLTLGIQLGKRQTKDSLQAAKRNPDTAVQAWENFVVKYLPAAEVPDSGGKGTKGSPPTAVSAPPAGLPPTANLPNFT